MSYSNISSLLRSLYTISPLLVVLSVLAIVHAVPMAYMLPALIAVVPAFLAFRWLHARVTGFVNNYTESVPASLMFVAAVLVIHHAMQEPGSPYEKLIMVLITLSTTFSVLYMRSYLDPTARNRFVDRSIVTPLG